MRSSVVVRAQTVRRILGPVDDRSVTERADLRLRAFDAVVRRIVPPVDAMTSEQLQRERSRTVPGNPLARFLFGGRAPGVSVADRRIERTDWSIPLRTYTPAGVTDPPIVVFLHGGGWVVGNVAQSTWMCSWIARRSQVLVVSAGYRLAPEHRFPVAVEDADDAVSWIAEHGHELGGDPSRLGLLGSSAGGNLAAVICQQARDNTGPSIGLQILLYPAVDVTQETPPRDYLDDAPMLPVADRIAYLGMYTEDAVDPYDPRISPLHADSLAGLPPALVITAEHDPLRDEARRYADRLRAEGTSVRYTDYAGMCHGFMSFPGLASGARQALAEMCQVIDATL
jgi:acetyl esterase